MEASKTADFYGCQQGHTIEVADAEQAYVQAEMKGLPTYVALPYEEVPNQFKKMNRPVFRLRKALYGHPEAGAYWEAHILKLLASNP